MKRVDVSDIKKIATDGGIYVHQYHFDIVNEYNLYWCNIDLSGLPDKKLKIIVSGVSHYSDYANEGYVEYYQSNVIYYCYEYQSDK